MRIGFFQRPAIRQAVQNELIKSKISLSVPLLEAEINRLLPIIAQQYDLIFEGAIYHYHKSGQVVAPINLAGEVAKMIVERLISARAKVSVLGQAPAVLSSPIFEHWGWRKIDVSPNKYVLYGEYKLGSIRKKGKVEVTVGPPLSRIFYVEEGGKWISQCVQNADSIEAGIILISRGL